MENPVTTEPQSNEKRNPARSGAPRKTAAATEPRVPPVGGAPKGYLAVGQIIGVHGLRGEVKVESWTDYADRFAPGATMALGDDLEPLTVRTSREHKGHVLIAFTGIADRTEAETLRGEWLFVPEHAASALDENAYWVHEVIGLRVFLEDGTPLGVVADVLRTGANDVYAVRRKGADDLLLPATDEVVLAVDIANGRMTVHLLDGLLE